MPICWHRCLDGFGICHVKLLEYISCVLCLTYECPLLQLLDLKPEEERQFTHHRHLKPLCHNPTKFFTKSLISTTKYYVIDIYLAHKYIILNLSCEESSVGFAYFKALLEQEILKAFIPCSWCLLKPIERLLEFIDKVGELGIFKPRWLCGRTS